MSFSTDDACSGLFLIGPCVFDNSSCPLLNRVNEEVLKPWQWNEIIKRFNEVMVHEKYNLFECLVRFPYIRKRICNNNPTRKNTIKYNDYITSDYESEIAVFLIKKKIDNDYPTGEKIEPDETAYNAFFFLISICKIQILRLFLKKFNFKEDKLSNTIDKFEVYTTTNYAPFSNYLPYEKLQETAKNLIKDGTDPSDLIFNYIKTKLIDEILLDCTFIFLMNKLPDKKKIETIYSFIEITKNENNDLFKFREIFFRRVNLILKNCDDIFSKLDKQAQEYIQSNGRNT